MYKKEIYQHFVENKKMLMLKCKYTFTEDSVGQLTNHFSATALKSFVQIVEHIQ